jgi:hypothetical protein
MNETNLAVSRETVDSIVAELERFMDDARVQWSLLKSDNPARCPVPTAPCPTERGSGCRRARLRHRAAPRLGGARFSYCATLALSERISLAIPCSHALRRRRTDGIRRTHNSLVFGPLMVDKLLYKLRSTGRANFSYRDEFVVTASRLLRLIFRPALSLDSLR